MKKRLDKRNGRIKKLKRKLRQETTASSANVAKAIFNVLDVSNEKVKEFEEETDITVSASEVNDE